MKLTALETVQVPGFDNLIWVRLHTDEGLIGLGETFRGTNAVAACLHAEVAPQILGRDPLAIEAHSARLTGPYIGFRSSGVEMRAASAVDIALWDLFGKATGQPLYQLLGGLARERIPTYNTCAGYFYNKRGGRREVGVGAAEAQEGPYDDQVAFNRDAGALARSLLEQGIGAMKIWPFDPFAAASGGHLVTATEIERGLEPLRQVRDAVGERMEIMIECHSLWDLPAALSIARRLQPFRPFWVEDPIKMLSPDALASYAARSGVPVCASETLATRASFLDLLSRDAVDYVMLDVSWCGGLTEARKIAALADAYQRPVAPHDCTGPVVFAASIHLSLSCPNAVYQESVRAYYSSWYRDLVTHVPVPVDGHFLPVPGPGLGTELNPALLERPEVLVRTTRLSDLP